MNKDIRWLIYRYLTLEEKVKIMEMNDSVLNRMIKEDINGMWTCHIPSCSPEFKIRGKSEEEVLWKIFEDDYFFACMFDRRYYGHTATATEIQEVFGINLIYTLDISIN